MSKEMKLEQPNMPIEYKMIEETFFVKQGRFSLEIKIDMSHPEKTVKNN